MKLSKAKLKKVRNGKHARKTVVKKKSNGNGKRLSPSQWEEIKIKWIQEGWSFSNLAHEYGTTESVIKHRSHGDEWSEKKKTFWASARRQLRERILEMFVQANLPPQKLIKLVCQGAISTTKLQNVKSDPIEMTRKNIKGKTIKVKPFTLDETITVEDNDTTLRYRELAVRLMDMFPAPKSTQKEEQEEFLPVVSHIMKVEKED